jgi:hypothetical protein
VSPLSSQLYITSSLSTRQEQSEKEIGANNSYAGWIGTVGAAHEGVPHPTLEDAATRLAAIAGTSTCHIAQSKEGILVPGVVRLHFFILISIISPPLPICLLSDTFVLLAPLTDPATSRLSSLAPLEARLTSSGDHTETQSSQDYG